MHLITGFVNGAMPVQEFERNYLQMVKNETCIFNEDTSKIIETLFSAVNAYCRDTEIANYNTNDPFADIDESELRKKANHALLQLK